MINLLNNIGMLFITKLSQLGQFGIFIVQLILRIPKFSHFGRDFIAQLYVFGVLSCSIIIMSGLFIGMVVGLQGYHTLEHYGATLQLGQLIALSIVRELGPVVSALLFAGRAGSALTAEIGLMKATEQLASMEVMGVDPLTRVMYPRFIAGFIALPLLSIIFSAVGIIGGYILGVLWLEVDAGGFWGNMQTAVDFRGDFLNGVLKSLVFAGLIMLTALYQGYNCEVTSEGISRATTKTVVYASLLILGFDFLLTSFILGDG
jgi:phospholipid/cholesterol/gamma-HCH transport system permease protein